MAACGFAPSSKSNDYEVKATEATVVDADDFDAEADAKVIQKAMKGMGTNEEKIIKVLANRTSKQIVQIKKKYETVTGDEMIKRLESELKGDFEYAIVCRCFTLAEMDAWFCRKAMAGVGTDEKALIDIICTKNNNEMKALVKAYNELYPKRDLKKDIKKECSGDFKRIMNSLVSCGRDEEEKVDDDKAVEEAKELYDAGAGKWGTDEAKFIEIMGLRSFEHLRVVFKAYRKASGTEMAEAIKKEMSGDLETAFLTLVNYIEDPMKYYANRCIKAMSGMGTDEKALIRVICTRCELDLELIKKQFKKEEKNGKDLGNKVAKELSGDLKKYMMKLVAEA